jgi:STE24 endopeptidase
MASPITLDPQRQTKAKEYAHIRRQLYFVDLGLSGLLTLAWLVFGWAAGVKAWWVTITQNDWLLVALFGAAFYFSFVIWELPLSYYSGFILPHRYGQSTQTLRGWVKDQLLGLLLSALIGLPLLEGVYWLLRLTGPLWWLWAAVGYIAFTVVLTNLAPVIIMPLFNKYVPLGEEHVELVTRLKTLAERAGTRVSGVFRFDMSKRTKAANAALTGLGGTRRIILGDTLLNEFTTDEVEVVIAHELGHHVHRDIPLYLGLSSALAVAGLYLASLALNWGVAAFRFSGPSDVAAMPLFALAVGVFSFVLTPVLNALSRWRERRADHYALQATHKPQAFANAMTRLANQNLADADPEPWVVFWFYSHPPIRQRVAMAENFKG